MTDQEVICAWMEPKPPLPNYWSGGYPSPKGWWYNVPISGGRMDWIPWRNGRPMACDLNALWEVEERLTDMRWLLYYTELAEATKSLGLPHEEWRCAHATPEQKIKALAAVLRPLVETAAA